MLKINRILSSVGVDVNIVIVVVIFLSKDDSLTILYMFNNHHSETVRIGKSPPQIMITTEKRYWKHIQADFFPTNNEK